MISGFVDTYLRLTAAEMKQYEAEVSMLPQPEREKAMEIVTSWMEEGIEKGLQQGLQQGRQEATVSLVTRFLNRRLGLIEASVLEQVQGLSLEQLEALSEDLLDFVSVADLQQWLATHHS
jgi:flagellar biosynthesis/type III secretory pathway protein FliH